MPTENEKCRCGIGKHHHLLKKNWKREVSRIKIPFLTRWRKSHFETNLCTYLRAATSEVE